MSKHQQTGMRGVYLAAAEIAARNLIVSPTSRSAAGADLLVTDESCTKAFSVQVKTNDGLKAFWLVGKKAQELSSRSHIYVFVNIAKDGQDHEYFVVPSKFVAEKVTVRERRNSTWYSIRKDDIVKRYRNKWTLLGAES